MMRLSSATVLCLLLASGAYGAGFKARRDLNVGAGFKVFSDDDSSSAGQDDAAATDLTDSIQGLFSDDAPAATKAAPAKAPAAPKPKAQKKAQAAVAKVAVESEKPAVAAPTPKAAVKVVKAAVAAPKPKATKSPVKVVKPAVAAQKPEAVKAAKVEKAKQPQVAKKVAAPQPKAAEKVVKLVQAKQVTPAKSVAKASPAKAVKAVEVKKPEAKAAEVKKPASKVALKVAAKAPEVKKPAAKVALKVAAKTPEVKKPAAKAPEKKVAAKAPEVKKSVTKAVLAKASKPIAKVQVSEKAGSAGVPVTKLQVAKVAANKTAAVKVVAKTAAAKKAKVVAKQIVKVETKTVKAVSKEKSMKAVHLNTPVTATPAVVSNATKAKEVKKATKAIEEAVPALPFASFALGDTVPVKNVTTKKFPGNATQKAEYDNKTQSLENEIENLKARLATTSKVVEAHASPKGTGMFAPKEPKAEAATPSTKKFMAAKKAAPVEPVKDIKPKAVVPTLPTLSAVAAPVVEEKEETEEEDDAAMLNAAKAMKMAMQPKTEDAAIQMSAAFTRTPVKKVESVLTLDAKVEQTAEVTEEDAATRVAEAAPSGFLSWFESFFSWFGGSSAATAAPKVASVEAPKVSLVQDDQPEKTAKRWAEAQRTAQATLDESQHVIQVNDAWNQMEDEDTTQVEAVRREDTAERLRAESAAAAHTLTKVELQTRHDTHVHGADMSSFWGSLEKEDSGIEHSVDVDDMGEYERLIASQTKQVTEAAANVKSTPKIAGSDHELKRDDDSRLAIHEPWARKEKRDIALEKKVHDAPELQMLQLKHRHTLKRK